jgi:RNA polymerase-binding transcription factor DksA
MATLSTYWSPSDLQGFLNSLLEQHRDLFEHLDAAQRLRASQMQSQSANCEDCGSAPAPTREKRVDESDRNIKQLRREIVAVESALNRLYRGVFGICVDCHEDIAASRLRSQPAAARCLPCESVHEAKHHRVSRAVLSEKPMP